MTSLDRPTTTRDPATPRPGQRTPKAVDRGGALRGVRRRARHGGDGAPRPALRHDLHDQQGPAPLGDRGAGRRARCWSVVRLVRKDTVKHAFSGVFGVAFGVVFAMMTGNAKDFYLPGMLYTLGLALAYMLTDARGRPADRADPGAGLQGEPLLAHPQPGPQEGVRQGQLGLGPDPPRQVRDPLPAVLVGGHHAAGLGPDRPEDPAVPARGLPHLGLPGEGAAAHRRVRGDGGGGEGREGGQGGAQGEPRRPTTRTPGLRPGDAADGAADARREGPGTDRSAVARSAPSVRRSPYARTQPAASSRAPTAGPPAAPRGPGPRRTAARRPPPARPPVRA